MSTRETMPNLRVVKLPGSVLSVESLSVLLQHPFLREVDLSSIHGLTYSDIVDVFAKVFGNSVSEKNFDLVQCLGVVHRTTSLRFPNGVRCLKVGAKLGYSEWSNDYFPQENHEFVIDTTEWNYGLEEIDLRAIRFRDPEKKIVSFKRIAQILLDKCPNLHHISLSMRRYDFPSDMCLLT